jgi:hypothetical protein
LASAAKANSGWRLLLLLQISLFLKYDLGYMQNGPRATPILPSPAILAWEQPSSPAAGLQKIRQYLVLSFAAKESSGDRA